MMYSRSVLVATLEEAFRELVDVHLDPAQASFILFPLRFRAPGWKKSLTIQIFSPSMA